MRISSSLSLLLLLLIVFIPTIQEWVTQGGSHWYRPYIVWLIAIIFVFFSQRSNRQDEL